MKGISALSHFVDETMPASVRDTLIRAHIDADEFQRHIGPQLGIFRSGEHVKSNMPSLSDEARFVLSLSDLLAKTEQQMTRSAIPSRTHAGLLEVFHLRLGKDWNELQERVRRDLQMVQAALSIISQGLRAQPAKRGPKPKQRRNNLLKQIEQEIERQLGPLKKNAQVLALEILCAYGIGAPSPHQDSPHKAAARAIKRAHRS